MVPDSGDSDFSCATLVLGFSLGFLRCRERVERHVLSSSFVVTCRRLTSAAVCSQGLQCQCRSCRLAGGSTENKNGTIVLPSHVCVAVHLCVVFWECSAAAGSVLRAENIEWVTLPVL